MNQQKPVSEKELREELLGLAEDLQEDILLLESLVRANLSDCCEPSVLVPLRRRVIDCIHQHGRDIGLLSKKFD